MGIESDFDPIQRIKEAVLRVAQTTKKGSLLARTSAQLPDNKRQREDKPRVITYGPHKTNAFYYIKAGRSGGRLGSSDGYGYYPTLNAMEAIGITSHIDSQVSAPKYED